MVEPTDINDSGIRWAAPETLDSRHFVGRAEELQMCRIAWGVDPDGSRLLPMRSAPLHFRLEGPPGLGKNEIVYKLARDLGIPLYIMQGHEEFTPEDLSLLLTPDPQADYGQVAPLTLRASPLATALRTGGLFFFDEINRVPERALSPLASVLDGRLSLASAMTGITITPQDEEARRTFRFCCALNPALSQAGHVLPEYIEQRTLPVIEVLPPPFEDLRLILKETLKPSEDLLREFDDWHSRSEPDEFSVRQAIALMNYAVRHLEQAGPQRAAETKGIIGRFARLVTTGRRQ